MFKKIKSMIKNRIGLESFLARYFSRNNGVIIQVGANDGEMCDPLRPFLTSLNVEAYLFEPLKLYYDKLAQRYSGKDNIRVINSALGEERSSAEIFLYRTNWYMK